MSPGLRDVLRPFEVIKDSLKIFRERRSDPQIFPGYGMWQPEFYGRKQQAVNVKSIVEHPVVRAFSVGGVTDDGMRNVLKMAAQLMSATAYGTQFEKRVTAAGITIDRHRQFAGCHCFIAGYRLLA